MDTAPLRVLVEDRPLRKALTGVGNYIYQLLSLLPHHAPEIAASPFMHTHLRRRDWRNPPAVRPEPAAPPRGDRRVPWLVRATLEAGYGAAFRWHAGRYQLYHEPNHIPLPCRLPTVTTIHDLSVVLHPEWHPADRVRWYERQFQRGLRQSRHFIAASEFTRRQICDTLGIASERVTVTYQAPRPAFSPEPPAGPSRDGAANPRLTTVEGADFLLPPGFFLYVGTLEPRKNVVGLLDAFRALPDSLRRTHPLLIAGSWGWKAQQIRERLEERSLAGQVVLLGYLGDQDLAALYRRCTALVWPTWFEGFGLPPLEALACGAPVIVSDVASLPEVVGDAGLRLDPRDTDAWTAAMRRSAEDTELRMRLAAAGPIQAARFSGERFVRDTVTAYRSALEA